MSSAHSSSVRHPKMNKLLGHFSLPSHYLTPNFFKHYNAMFQQFLQPLCQIKEYLSISNLELLQLPLVQLIIQQIFSNRLFRQIEKTSISSSKVHFSKDDYFFHFSSKRFFKILFFWLEIDNQASVVAVVSKSRNYCRRWDRLSLDLSARSSCTETRKKTRLTPRCYFLHVFGYSLNFDEKQTFIENF